MELETPPKRLVILGGGYIGLEFASMFANFGSEVTILQPGERFLPREDLEIADAVEASSPPGRTVNAQYRVSRGSR